MADDEALVPEGKQDKEDKPPKEHVLGRFTLEASDRAVLREMGWDKLELEGKVSNLGLELPEDANLVALYYPDLAPTPEEVEEMKKQLAAHLRGDKPKNLEQIAEEA